jgi:hypothetical protein
VLLVGLTAVNVVTAAWTAGRKEKRLMARVRIIRTVIMKIFGLIGKSKRVPSSCSYVIV